MPHIPASPALARFRVIDMTQVRAGPTAARQLADWGADVIQVQMPESMRGDDTLGGQDGSDYQYTHRNKRSITLNLKEPEGIEVLKKLVGTADVLLENFRPDVKHRLGIDYEALSAVNPRLIYASISGFGQDGPYANRPGFDQIAQGMGGLMSITGAAGQGPMRVGIPVADLTAGLFCAMGIMVALLERETSGKGQAIDTSLLQAQLFMLDFQASRWTMSGEVPGQAGNNHPTSIPTGVFKTSDGYINIAATGQKMWTKICELIGEPQMANDPKYNSGAARLKNRDALNEVLESHTVKRTSAEWVDALNKAGVPCGPIYSVDQAFGDAQVKHLGIARGVRNQEQKMIHLVGQPVSLSRTPSDIVAATPHLGEHTDEVLVEFGFSKDDISKLRAEKTL